MEILHDYNLANKVYDFKRVKYSSDDLKQLLDYSNMGILEYKDIVRYQPNLTEELFREYVNIFGKYINLYTENHKFSDNFMVWLYDNNLFNCYIITNQKLSNDTINHILQDHNIKGDKYIDTILEHQNLSNNMILTYIDNLDLKILSTRYEISMTFAKEIEDRLKTDEDKSIFYTNGSVYQRWTDEFITENKKYIDWYRMYIYPERVFIHDHYIDHDTVVVYMSNSLNNNIQWIGNLTDKSSKVSHKVILESSNNRVIFDYKNIDTISGLKVSLSPKVSWPVMSASNNENTENDTGSEYYPVEESEVEWPILTDPADARPLIVNNKHITPDEWKILIGTQFPVYDHNDDYFIGYIIVDTDNYDRYTYMLKYDDNTEVSMFADITNAKKSFGIRLMSRYEAEHLTHDYSIGGSIRQFKVKLVKVYWDHVAYAKKHSTGYEIRVDKVEVFRDL